jgi:hypothetical protein
VADHRDRGNKSRDALLARGDCLSDAPANPPRVVLPGVKQNRMRRIFHDDLAER